MVKRRIIGAMSKNDITTKVELNLPPKAMLGRGNASSKLAEAGGKHWPQ